MAGKSGRKRASEATYGLFALDDDRKIGRRRRHGLHIELAVLRHGFNGGSGLFLSSFAILQQFHQLDKVLLRRLRGTFAFDHVGALLHFNVVVFTLPLQVRPCYRCDV